ncbi:MAG: protein-L-isoaspartate(D-aspartate) O-methyltransferase [Hyphomicrobiaceae bacterium]
MQNTQELRDHMVQTQLADRGIRDGEVLRAMRIVPREKFVPRNLSEVAYDDGPLPIGAGQTISQPFIVALMIAALSLQRGDVVLEVGAGSGYAAAVLSEITGSAFAIERIHRLAEKARTNLSAAGYGDVHIRNCDGTVGWPDAAPFDAILVSAGAPKLPNTLKEQLKIGGRMVVPIGTRQQDQILVLVTRIDEVSFKEENLGDVRFVPLIGSEGWHVSGRGIIQDDVVFGIS